MKDDLPFFPHDNNARNHPKMKALIAEYGYEGYGRFWALNEKIAETSGAFIDISKKINKLALAKELDFNGDELNKFLKFLSDPEIDLINIKDNIITTDRTSESYKAVINKRKKQREKKQNSDNEKIGSDFGEINGDNEEIDSDFDTEEKRIEENKREKNKYSCGEPPEKKQRKQRKKPNKPRLRFREPENDIEFVEKPYWTNWDMLYSKKLVNDIDPIVNWGHCRRQINNLFDKNISPDRLVTVVNKALRDDWILEHGYSLEKILTYSYVNSIINKIPVDNSTELVIYTPLYSTALSCFEKDIKTKALLYQDEYSKNMQYRCLLEIINRCKNIVPDMPEALFENIIEQFRSMCNGKFKGKWVYTPRCLKTDWIWELVIDSLPNTDDELTIKVKENIKGMFK
jgi:hypothetical protein